MRILKYDVLAALLSAALLSSCAQGGRVAMGNKYAAVATEAAMPGFATYNAFGSGNLYANSTFLNANAQDHATGFAMGPQRFVGLNIQGIVLKRIASGPTAR